jgi:hypothetical protein
MDRRGIAYRNFMMNPPLLSNGMAPLQLAQGASLSPTYRPAALTFQKFKRKYGILKTFMKRRPRLFWTFIKRDDDDEDVTWRDYGEYMSPALHIGEYMSPALHIGEYMSPALHIGEYMSPALHIGEYMSPALHIGEYMSPALHIGEYMSPALHMSSLSGF